MHFAAEHALLLNFFFFFLNHRRVSDAMDSTVIFSNEPDRYRMTGAMNGILRRHQVSIHEAMNIWACQG